MNTQEFIDKWTDRPGEREVMARDIEALLAAQIAALQAERTQLRAESDGLRTLVQRTIQAGSQLFGDPNSDPNWHWKDYLMELDKIIVDGRKVLEGS